VQPVTTLTNPLLNVSPGSIRVSSTSASREILIISNRNWTATSSDQSWVSLSQVGGSSSGTIIAAIRHNTGSNNRAAKITVTAGGLTQEVEIIQEGIGETAKNVSVAFYYHRTYRDAFSDYAGEARSMLNDANRAFLAVHNVNLVFQQGVVTNNLYMDECFARHSALCSVMCCGDAHILHYKDASMNLEQFTAFGFNRNNSRLGVLAYRSPLCTIYGDGSHDAVGGMARSSGRTSMVDFKPTQRTPNVRVMQHEFAHNFGVSDGYPNAPGSTVQCTSPSSVCIMGGLSLMWDNDFGRSDTFCAAHRQQFNRNLH